MTDFLTFSDFELEFLRNLDILYKNNCFYSTKTGNSFNCVDSGYRPIKELNNQSNTFSCTFKGKDGAIVFVRSGEKNSIIFRTKDVALVAHEEQWSFPKNYDGYDVNENETEEIANITKELKRIYIFGYVYGKLGKKTRTLMEIYPGIYPGSKINDLSCLDVALYASENAVEISRSLHCGMDKIHSIFGVTELCVEEYKDVYEELVQSVFESCPQIIPYYIKLRPMFMKVFENSLYIPALLEKRIRHSYSVDREDAENTYLKNQAAIEKKRKEALDKIDSEEEKLNKIIEQYPISTGRQK